MSARATGGLGLALVVGAACFDAPSLYVPGVALGLLALGAVCWTSLAARGVQVARLPGPATVVEGEPYPLRVVVRRGALAPRGELHDPLLAVPLPLGRRRPTGRRTGVREVELAADARFERRGRRRLDPPRLLLGDPLGLSERSIEGVEPGAVLVLPRVEPVRATARGGGDDAGALEGVGEGAGTGLTAVLDVEIDGLRPYREGSPASRIHWPAVARHHELIERRLVSGDEATAVVILDSTRPESEGALDCAVRAAASLCVHLARAGGCALIVAGEPRALRIDTQLRGWPQAHARLALVEPGGSLPAIARAVRGRSVFWVVAAPRAAPRALGAGPGSYLVTPADDRRATFAVAGCYGRPMARSAGARPAARRAA